MFITLQGYPEEFHDSVALGLSLQDPPAAIAEEERSLVWELAGVKDLMALKSL
jgi:hypothetical protein